MSVCSLSDNQDLKIALEELVNGLIDENSKGTKFDPAVITQTVYDTLSPALGVEKALGITYHVPQLIFDIINENPAYDLKTFIKKGYDSAIFINDVITPLEQAEDKLKAIGARVGASDLSVEETEEILSNIPASTITVKASVDSEAREDKHLAGVVGSTTQETSKEIYDKTTKKFVPVKNESDPDKMFHQTILADIVSAKKDKDSDFSTVEYKGKKGFKLKGMLEKDLNVIAKGKIRADRNYWLSKFIAIAVITDNDGNIRYFNEDGSIGDIDTGRPVYFNMRSVENLDALERLKESAIKTQGAEFNKQQFREAVEKQKALSKRIKAGEEVMLDIVGGMKGTFTNPDTLTSEEQKEVQRTLSDFDLSQAVKESIKLMSIERNGFMVPMHSILFEGLDTYVSLKNTESIGKQDPSLLDHIVDILTEQITTLKGVMTPKQKVEYIRQFISPTRVQKDAVLNKDGKEIEKENKGYTIGTTTIGSKDQLVINFGGSNINLANKEQAKIAIKNFLGEHVSIHLDGKSYNQRTYDKITLSKTFEATEEAVNYWDFISTKMTPRIIMDKRTNLPMIINGYFTYEEPITKAQVNDKVKTTTKEVDKADIPITPDDKNYGISKMLRSKLFANTATPAQKAAAEKWWKEETALSKAVDADGKPLFTLSLLSNTANSDAWADFSNAVITLYEGADYTHAYHEAWHAFSQVYLTYNERTNLYEGVNKLKGSFDVIKKIGGPDGTTYEKTSIPFSTATRQEAEEFIAEEFRVYAMNGGKFKVKSEKTTLLGKLFARIWKALRALAGKATDINVYSNPGSQGFLTDIFNTLYTAKTKDDLASYLPTLKNAEFGTLNAGIINPAGETVLTLSEALLLSRTIDGIISDFTTSRVKQGEFSAVSMILNDTRSRAGLYRMALDKLNTRRASLIPESVKLAEEIDKLEGEKNEASAEEVVNLSEEIFRLTTKKVILDNKIAILTKATAEETYGSVEKMLDGKDTHASVVAFHHANSSFKDVFGKLDKADLEKDPIDIDETNSDQEGQLNKIDVPTNGIASEDLASNLVLYLVKSLTKQDRLTGEPELNELGFAEPIEFKPFWRVLMDKASGETSILGLYEKLVAAGNDVHPLFKQLLSKITNIEPDPNKSAYSQFATMFTKGSAISDLWLKLVQALNLHKVDLITTVIKQDPETKELKLTVGRSTADHQKIINKDWPSRFQQEPKGEYIKKDSDGVNYINLANVGNKFIILGKNLKGETTYSVKKDDYIPFLNSIGLYLSNNDATRDALLEGDVSYIIDAIGKKAASMKGNVNLKNDGISNISNFLGKPHTVTINGKDVIIPSTNRALNEIGALEANYSDAYSSSMKLTPSGDKKSVYALNSTITQIVKAFNKARLKSDLYINPESEPSRIDASEFMHMNFLDPRNNPTTAGLITMNSLFDKVDGRRVADNSLQIFDLAGTQYIDPNYTSKGVVYNKMNYTDKILSSILATLANGFMETTTPGDKSSYFCMKLDKIITYKGKKLSYLYVDTDAFLKNKDDGYLKGYDPMQEVLGMLYPKLEGEIKRIAMIKADPEYYNRISGFENALKFDIFDEILDSKTEGSKLKNNLTSEAFFKKLEKAGSLIKLLTQDKVLKSKIDKEILEYFNTLEERYEKNIMQPVFGDTNVLPELLTDVVLKDVDRTKLGEVDYTDADGVELSSIEANIKQAAIKSFMINNFIHKIETTALFQGDGFQFNHEKDEQTKRAPGSQSGGRIFTVDALLRLIINTKVKRPYEELLLRKSIAEGGIVRKKGLEQAIRTYNGYMNTAMLNESVVASEYVEMYDKLFRRDMAEKGYTDKNEIDSYLYGVHEDGTIGTLDTIYKGGKLHPFTEIQDGDGQGWISFDSYRILKKSEGMWSQPQEDAFQAIISGKTLTAFELSEIFPVYKLQYYGALATETGKYPVQAFHKFSLFPLIPSVIKGFPAEDMHKAMMAQNIDYATFTSGSKRSYINGKAGVNGDLIYNGDTSNIKPHTEIEFTPNRIYVAYLKNQTDVNSKFKNNATFSTQLRKLITGGLYQYGVPVDYLKNNKKKFKTPENAIESWSNLTDKQKLKASEFHKLSEEFTKTLADLVAAKKEELLEELEHIENKNGSIEGNRLKMIQFLEKELKRQGFSDHELSILTADNPEKVDLSISPLAARFEKLIMGVINNRLVRIKLGGEAFVQLSSALMQKFRKPTKAELKEYGAFGTNGLRSYVTDPGKKTLGFMFKRALNKMDHRLFKTSYFILNDKGEYEVAGKIAVYDKSKDENGKETSTLNFDKSFDRLNEMLRLDVWRNDDENYKKVRLTGVRIPVQGDNSMEFGEVAEFLKPEAGTVIIIPAEIVAKSGGDFDVDKLTTYLPFITRNGKLLKNRSKKELQETIDELQPIFDRLKSTPEAIKIFKDKKSAAWSGIVPSLDKFRKAIKIGSASLSISEKKLEQLLNPKSKELVALLKDPAMDLYLKNWFPKAYKIYTKEIKGITLEELENVEDALTKLYEENTEFGQIARELYDAEEALDNHMGGIQNQLIDNMISIMELPEKAASLMSPNDTNIAKPIAKALEKAIQKADNETDFTKSIKTGKALRKKGISSTNIYTEDYNNKKQQENISGKGSLGIAAVDNYINVLLNMAGTTMNKFMSVKAKVVNENGYNEIKVKDVPITLMVKHNLLDRKISLSHILDSNGEHSIAEVISQMMNGFLDVGKDAWVAYLQGNIDVIPKILFMLEAGVPIQDIAYLVSNPITRSYIKDKNKRSSTLSPLIYGSFHNSDVFVAAKEARSAILEEIELPYEASANITDTDYNMYGLSKALEHYSNSAYFTEKNLKRVAHSSINMADQAQVAGFLQYLYIEKLIEDYDDFKRVLNPDTKPTNDFHSAESKIRDVARVGNSATIDPALTTWAKEKSIIAPFFIQAFARNLFGRVFKLRTNKHITKFLLDITDKKLTKFKDRPDTQGTGYDIESYIINFKNFISQYIFANELTQYTPDSKIYKGIPISDKFFNQVNEDWNNKNWQTGNTEADSYLDRGLTPINPAAFIFSNKQEELSSKKAFLEFALEREYLRRQAGTQLTDIKNSKEFQLRKRRLASTGSIVYAKFAEESEEVYQERLNNLAYEDYLMNKALTNTYNIWQLFRSGDNTVARELMDIINNYPEIGEHTNFSMLQQFTPLSITDDPKLRGLVNFGLKNYSQLEEGLIGDYNSQWQKLIDKDFELIGDSLETGKAINYISEFFNNLPIYAFLQSGMSSGEFSLSSVMPYKNYQAIMEKSSKAFTNKLASEDPTKLLKGLQYLFENENQLRSASGIKYATLRNRGGMNIRRGLSTLKYAEESLFNKPFLTQNKANSGVFTLNRLYFENGETKTVTMDQIQKLAKANQDVAFLTSPRDLNVYLKSSKNSLTAEESNLAQKDILVAINKIVSSGQAVVIYPEGFVPGGISIKSESLTGTMVKPVVTSVAKINSIGDFVEYKENMYIILKKNENGTLQLYSPLLQGVESKISVSPKSVKRSIEAPAKKVTYKNKNYLVTDQGTIISLVSNTIMKWGPENGDRKAILALASSTPTQVQSGNVISEPYGVISVETNPSKAKIEEFTDLIRPQIKEQAIIENKSSRANYMFQFGNRWARVELSAEPILINQAEGNKARNEEIEKLKAEGKNKTDKFIYAYHKLDQHGKPLPSLSVLQPIIDEIQKATGIDMSNYDSVIGNIYTPGQSIATHRDVTESASAKQYPVVVYTLGAGNALNIYESKSQPGAKSFASDNKIKIPTKAGTIYTFGLDGKGRFEMAHDTPTQIKKGDTDATEEPITLPNGTILKDYTITLTFRRANDLEAGMPLNPRTGSTTKPIVDFKELPDFTTERKREIITNFAAKHKMTKDEAYKHINNALVIGDRDSVIKKLKECY